MLFSERMNKTILSWGIYLLFIATSTREVDYSKDYPDLS